MIIKFEYTDAGICLTDCPYVKGVKIGSMACELCACNFGNESGGVKCNGGRLLNETR